MDNEQALTLQVELAFLLEQEEISREQFASVFDRVQRLLSLEDNDLAKIFQISRPTVGRWARGEAAVHPIGRKPILNHLATLIAASLG